MDHPIPVRIFGLPTACATGVTDAWRQAAAWARRQLTARFGQQVSVEYYDLFSAEMDRFPEVLALVAAGQGQVPLVFVDGELLSSGGKVSVPDIRRRLEAMGLKPQR
mgnify:CR=1 FL=1